MLLVLFPIQAPRERTASTSAAIWTHSSSVTVSHSLIFRRWEIMCLCCSEPRGMISIFSMLNFAPESLHHLVSSL